MLVMGVLVRVHRAVRMAVLMRVFVLVILHVRVFLMLVFVGGMRNYVNLRSGQTGAGDFSHLQARTDIEGRRGPFEYGERDARVDERTKQHVAANAGKALQITDSHE